MSTEQTNNDFKALHSIVKRLRGPDGCPWDQKQTPESIKKYLIEETEELAEAMSGFDSHHICEEIGDLFFILTMIARIYEDNGQFTLENVFNTITTKMIRRHPHVFAGMTTGTANELKEQWESIKANEKKNR